MFRTYNAGVFRRESAPRITVEIIYFRQEIGYAGARGAGQLLELSSKISATEQSLLAEASLAAFERLQRGTHARDDTVPSLFLARGIPEIKTMNGA